MTAVNNNIETQTEEEFFAYMSTPEVIAHQAAVDAKVEADSKAFWALHFGIDMTAPGAEEKLAAERAAYQAHFADFDDNDSDC